MLHARSLSAWCCLRAVAAASAAYGASFAVHCFVLVLLLLLLLLLRLLPAVYLIISFQLAPFGNQSLHSVFALATFT